MMKRGTTTNHPSPLPARMAGAARTPVQRPEANTDTTPAPKRRTVKKTTAAARKPAATKRTGRRTRLTAERIAQIAALVADGVPGESAALVCGVRRTAYYDWMAKGRREIDRLAELGDPEASPAPSMALFTDLTDAVQKAQAMFEMRELANIRRAAESGAWQASAWRLERRMPEKYGKQWREPARDDARGALVKAIVSLTATDPLPGE